MNTYKIYNINNDEFQGYIKADRYYVNDDSTLFIFEKKGKEIAILSWKNFYIQAI